MVNTVIDSAEVNAALTQSKVESEISVASIDAGLGTVETVSVVEGSSVDSSLSFNQVEASLPQSQIVTSFAAPATGSTVQQNYAVIKRDVGSVKYVALGLPGADPAAAVWRCLKIDKSGSSTVVLSWADGDDTFDNVPGVGGVNLPNLFYV